MITFLPKIVILFVYLSEKRLNFLAYIQFTNRQNKLLNTILTVFSQSMMTFLLFE